MPTEKTLWIKHPLASYSLDEKDASAVLLEWLLPRGRLAHGH